MKHCTYVNIDVYLMIDLELTKLYHILQKDLRVSQQNFVLELPLSAAIAWSPLLKYYDGKSTRICETDCFQNI